MRLREIRELLSVRRPAAPYGVRRLARVCSIEDLARLARRRLPAGVLGYLDGGGEGEVTLRRNRAAFEELQLIPRVLRDVSAVDLSTTVLDTPTPLPLVLAPIGSARIFHHDGELAAARAAARAGVPFSLSSSGTCSIERVAAESHGPLWYQLYVWRDRGLCRELIERARAAGYRALLVTADTTVRSKREREIRAGITLPNPALTISTLIDGVVHPNWSWHFLTKEAIRFANLSSLNNPPRQGMARMARSFDGLTTWDDIEWIADAWRGPLALKGVLSVEDARRAADLGVQAVVVSNHGGRQLDHVPAAVEVLPAIVDAVADRVEILMDSGVRRGTDVVTALALGAKACLLGRAPVYGLAAAGEAGVRLAIDILAGEIRTAMALCGAARIGDLTRDHVRQHAVPQPGVDGAGRPRERIR